MRFSCVVILLFINAACSGQDMYRTACQGNIDRLDSLLQHENINTQDRRGRTLAHWATACKQREVLDYLIQEGADINVLDDEGVSPLFMTVRFQNEAIFDHISSQLSKTDWVDDQGVSLLERAILNRDAVFIKKLANKGVDINGKNKRGSTPLEIAQRLQAPALSDLIISLGGEEKLIRDVQMTGSYMGQYFPKLTPRLFAPNFISTEEHEFGSVFSDDGSEFYYGVDVNGRSEIRYSTLQQGLWTDPQVIISHDIYGYNDPFLSVDGHRLYYISNMPMNGIGDPKDIDIWYSERTSDKWSDPINAGSNINTLGEEYYISFTKKGDMYFASDIDTSSSSRNHDIYSSTYTKGEYQKATKLPTTINTEHYEADVFIDPHEQYMIFCATRPDGLGRGDLYVSFKSAQGKWSVSTSLGAPINTSRHELCPYVSSDGKYLFYTSDGDIYWVSMEAVYRLR